MTGRQTRIDLLRITATFPQVAKIVNRADAVCADVVPACGHLRHGRLVQVELDALPPDLLRILYDAEISQWWDEPAYEDVLAREAEDVAVLEAVLAS